MMSKVRGPCLPRNMKSDPFTPTTSPVSGGTSASKVVSKVWAFKMVRTRVGFCSFGSSGFRIEFRCKTNRPCSSRIASVTIVPASLGSLCECHGFVERAALRKHVNGVSELGKGSCGRRLLLSLVRRLYEVHVPKRVHGETLDASSIATCLG